MAIRKEHRLPLGVICTIVGAILVKHSYSSPFTPGTPAEQGLGSFLLFFYGPYLIFWAFFDFGRLWPHR
jgi:hypothetical protein